MSETQEAIANEQDLRAALQRRAAQVIDGLSVTHVTRALQDEGAVPANAEAPDLMTLLTEMAGLRQEVRLQRRELVKIREMQMRASQHREDDDGTLRRALQDKLAPFLDVRDALARAHDRQVEPPTSVLPVWQRFVRALRAKFYRDATPAVDVSILLQQIDRALAQAEVVPIAVLGQEFDPEIMVAVAVVQTDAVPVGVVTQQIVGGFLIESQLWRPAQVVVNQAAALGK